MADTPESKAGRSRLIKEHALRVLRETRAKIDPALLEAMKNHIQAAGLAGAPLLAPSAGHVAQAAELEKKGVFSARDVDALSLKKENIPPPPPKPVAPTKAADSRSEKPVAASPEMVPVDKKKVSAIVMEYMRAREENKPGH